MARPGTISLLLTISALCICSAAQTKPVDQLRVDAEHGDKGALQELITLGNAGNAEAQFNLGWLYNDGKDVVESAKWYRKAAEQGHAIAELNLSVFYLYGEGVPKDHVQSANWCEEAAQQGLAIAQYALAWKYANGDGVAKDNVQAFKWYNLAAAQGFVGAKANRDMFAKTMTHAEIEEGRKLSREWKPKK